MWGGEMKRTKEYAMKKNRPGWQLPEIPGRRMPRALVAQA